VRLSYNGVYIAIGHELITLRIEMCGLLKSVSRSAPAVDLVSEN
jgi:hypothetical protein